MTPVVIGEAALAKTCRRCAINKQNLDFSKNINFSDGLAVWCRACQSEASRAHYFANKEKCKAAIRAWRAANPSVIRIANLKYSRNNKATRAAKFKKWAQENRGARRATDAKRKASKLQATPAWANLKVIRTIYQEAAAIQAKSGIRMHVDHIVPLQSELVCGLHCEANLEIITGAANEAKNNYWWPDMPGVEQVTAQPDLFAPEPMKQEQATMFAEAP